MEARYSSDWISSRISSPIPFTFALDICLTYINKRIPIDLAHTKGNNDKSVN